MCSFFEKTRGNTDFNTIWREFLICTEQTLETLDAGVENLQKKRQRRGIDHDWDSYVPLGVEYAPRLAASYLAEHSDKRIDFTLYGCDITFAWMGWRRSGLTWVILFQTTRGYRDFRPYAGELSGTGAITPRKASTGIFEGSRPTADSENIHMFFSRNFGNQSRHRQNV